MAYTESSEAISITQTSDEHSSPHSRKWVAASLAGITASALLLSGCGSRTEAAGKNIHPAAATSTTPGAWEVSPTQAADPSSTATPEAQTGPPTPELGPVEVAPHTPLDTFVSAVDITRTNQIVAQYPQVGDYIFQAFQTSAALSRLTTDQIGLQQQLIHQNYPKVLDIDKAEQVEPSTFTPAQAAALAKSHLLGARIVSFTDTMLRYATKVQIPGQTDYPTVDMAFLEDSLVANNKQLYGDQLRHTFPTVARSAIVAVATGTKDFGVFGDPQHYKLRMDFNSDEPLTAVATVTQYTAEANESPLTEFRWTLIVPIGQLAAGGAATSDIGICIYKKTLAGNSNN